MREFRREASWAVWPINDDGLLTGEVTFPAEGAKRLLHGRAMIVSLNPGSDRAGEGEDTTPDWANFHSPDRIHNDHFLAEAFLDTPFWGSYMTDLPPRIAEIRLANRASHGKGASGLSSRVADCPGGPSR